MIYPILTIGHPVLTAKTEDIDKNYPELAETIDNMFETMHACDGVGLAAPQIGKPIRLFVIDAEPVAENDDFLKNFKRTFINPLITEESGEDWYYNEGCLSIPTIREDIKRKNTIKIKYYDREWNCIEETLTGIAARIVQHEYDHLKGILFVDHLSTLKRRLLKGKISDVSKGKVHVDYRIKIK